jgi:hypothetical protein
MVYWTKEEGIISISGIVSPIIRRFCLLRKRYTGLTMGLVIAVPVAGKVVRRRILRIQYRYR